MNNYYLLKTIPDSSNKVAENSVIISYDQTQLLKGEFVIPELTFKVKKGFDKFDFLETNLPGIKLCSDKVIQLLNKNGFLGWSGTKVLINYKDEILSNLYSVFHIHGKAGPLDYSKSQIITKGNSFVELKGRSFAEEAIGDSDFFVPEKTVMVLVKERVRDIFEAERVTNITLTSIADFVGLVSTQTYLSSLKGN